MWPLDHAFSTYTWPGPFGWVAHNCPGNVVAGFIQVALAAVAASLLWPPSRRAIHRFVDAKLAPIHEHLTKQASHNRWMAEIAARTHLATTGEHAPPHPEHGQLTHDGPRPVA